MRGLRLCRCQAGRVRQQRLYAVQAPAAEGCHALAFACCRPLLHRHCTPAPACYHLRCAGCDAGCRDGAAQLPSGWDYPAGQPPSARCGGLLTRGQPNWTGLEEGSPEPPCAELSAQLGGLLHVPWCIWRLQLLVDLGASGAGALQGAPDLSRAMPADMPGGSKFSTQATFTFRDVPGGCQLACDVACTASGPYGLTGAIECEHCQCWLQLARVIRQRCCCLHATHMLPCHCTAVACCLATCCSACHLLLAAWLAPCIPTCCRLCPAAFMRCHPLLSRPALYGRLLFNLTLPALPPFNQPPFSAAFMGEASKKSLGEFLQFIPTYLQQARPGVQFGSSLGKPDLELASGRCSCMQS